MTASPFPVNSTATVVNEGIDGIFSVAAHLSEAAIEAAIIAEIPPLANPALEPLLRDLIDFVVGDAANIVYQNFARFVTFGIIDAQTSGEASDDMSALAALKTAQAGGNPDAIQKALQAFGKAASALTVIDGAANPGSL